jgi:hypothetical protein
MEEKICKRQVAKEGLTAGVVDKQQVHRTTTKEEVLLLFNLEDNDNTVNNSDGVKELRLTQLGITRRNPTPLVKMISDGSSSLRSIWQMHLAFA